MGWLYVLYFSYKKYVKVDGYNNRWMFSCDHLFRSKVSFIKAFFFAYSKSSDARSSTGCNRVLAIILIEIELRFF